MSLTFEMGDFAVAAARMAAAADQIPFALAGALNDAVDVARKELIETTWPSHVQVRNARFLRAALTTRGSRATKRQLRVELYDQLGRGSLALHEDGGVKHPKGAALAVPNKANVQPKRTSKGVPQGLRPRNLPASFVKQSKYGPVIFQRTGTYRKGSGKKPGRDDRHLKAMYGLASSARIPAEVPFHRDFDRIMRREVVRAFGPRLAAAMATRAGDRRFMISGRGR